MAARLCAAALGLVVLSSCTSGPHAPAAATPVEQAVPPCSMQRPAADGPVRSETVVDFVDFIHWGGREYLAGPSMPPLSDEDLGAVVGVSRCSFRELNDTTGQMTPAPVDGDTGYLPAGTQFFAVSGRAPECRLAARHDGRLTVYLAQDPDAAQAMPSACAL